MNKKYYKVKVIERHVDILWVSTESQEEAKDIAHSDATCAFECVEDCIILEERDQIDSYCTRI